MGGAVRAGVDCILIFYTRFFCIFLHILIAIRHKSFTPPTDS